MVVARCACLGRGDRSAAGGRHAVAVRLEGSAQRPETAGAGTHLTWTNEGDMGTNPVNRDFGRFMDRLVGPDFEGCRKDLESIAEG